MVGEMLLREQLLVDGSQGHEVVHGVEADHHVPIGREHGVRVASMLGEHLVHQSHGRVGLRLRGVRHDGSLIQRLGRRLASELQSQ